MTQIIPFNRMPNLMGTRDLACDACPAAHVCFLEPGRSYSREERDQKYAEREEILRKHSYLGECPVPF